MGGNPHSFGGTMAGFTSELVAKYHSEKAEWEVIEEFWFQRNNGDQLKVPKGFITDLASTNNMIGFPKDDVYNQAAVLHDYLYAAEIFPRSISDKIFKEALTAIKEVPRWKIPIMYWAVRAFGGITYKQHTDGSICHNRMLAGLRNLVTRPLWKDGEAWFI